MKQAVKEFLETFDYPQEAQAELLRCYNVLAQEDEFVRAVEAYSQQMDCNLDEKLKQIETIANRKGENVWTAQFVYFVCLSPQLKKYYLQNGIDESIWYNTMLDLKYKLTECHLVKYVWGSFVPWWFVNFFLLKRFGLGRLQFIINDFWYDYDDGKLHLVKGQPCIAVHIPRTGTKLSYDEVAKSYQMAKEFFSAQFVGVPTLFICHSWILHDKIQNLLLPSSNLRAFAKDYTVIEQGEDNGYGEVWRLFDADYDGNVNNLPQDTSLRKSVAEMISNGEKFGWGFGVFFYE